MRSKELVQVLLGLGNAQHVPIETPSLEQSVVEWCLDPDLGDLDLLLRAGLYHRLRLGVVSLTFSETQSVLLDGISIAFKASAPDVAPTWYVLTKRVGKRIEAKRIHGDGVENRTLTQRELKGIFRSAGGLEGIPCLCAHPFLLRDKSSVHSSSQGHGHAHAASDSSSHGSHHSHGGHHSATPLSRLLGLLRLDLADILSLVVFGVTASILSLASPLAVEWVVTTIGFGRYLQPLVVLAILLFTLLGFAGAMRILQSVVVEGMQRRLMVRLVGDLSYRLPSARSSEWESHAPTELLNRFFDIATIQKAIATLLLDGMAIILSTCIGLLLLAFYHPFLLGFDIVLLLAMTLVTFVLGRGAVRTAKQESIVKYKLGHWLQDLASCSTTFRLNGGVGMAIERANRLTEEYLQCRKRHFACLLRQGIFAVSLQVIASTALLGIGGWLVIDSQLTLGQLVASELVVTVIVGAFAKIGKSLETFYDMLASIDKVGHVLDLSMDPLSKPIRSSEGPSSMRWQNLHWNHPSNLGAIDLGTGEIAAGKAVAMVSESAWKTSALLEIFAGLRDTGQGFVEMDGVDAREWIRFSHGQRINLVAKIEIFDGTILENMTLGRTDLHTGHATKALEEVGLLDEVRSMPDGYNTHLLSNGFPLSMDQAIRLMLARAIVASPQVLLIDRLLDMLPDSQRLLIHKMLLREGRPWTLLIATHDPNLIQQCELLRV